MNTLSELDSKFPSGSCPCGCRGNRELHEAFESRLTGEVWRQRRFARRPPPRAGAAQPTTPRPRPKPGYRPRARGPGRVYVHEPYPVAFPYEPEPTPEPIQEPRSEHGRWVQDCLNRIFALRLPVNGILDAASRSAVRRLQKQEGLRMNGIVGPDTEQALRTACGTADSQAVAVASEVGWISDTEISQDKRSTPFEVISRFSTYSRSVALLPAPEREKIDRIARFVVHGLRSGKRSIRTIRLIGHADPDTPRRPAFEQQIAFARARDVQLALSRALDHVDRSDGRRAVPPYSSRVAWEVRSVGATRLIVPNPRAEIDRLRNRRVEISLIPHSGSVPHTYMRVAKLGFAPLAALDVRPGAAIDDFLRRAPNDLLRFKDEDGDDVPNRKICVQAVATKAMQLCRTANVSDRDVTCAPPLTLTKGRCFSGAETRGLQILAGKDYRSPITAPVRCCNVTIDCKQPMNQNCVNCTTLSPGHYLVLKYKPQPLRIMVDKLKCLLDGGCVVPVGVLSGICDDKPDLTCKAAPENRWRDCWEHWLLVIGYEGDTFVFWDSASASQIGPIKRDKDNHWFGFLHFDSRPDNERLSTATTDPRVKDALEVDSDGFHTQGFPRVHAQKRYQVVSMWPGLPWKAIGRSC